MSSDERATEIAALLTAAGVTAFADTRSATPPCVLVVPPDLDFDLGCSDAATAHWNIWALASGTGNADAHKQLAGMVRTVALTVPVERAVFGSYVLSVDNPALPAYRCELQEGISL